MRSVFIYVLLISFVHSQAFGVSYLTGDAIRSPDRSKTWLMPDASDTLVGKETEDTLKNKTLENPEIEGALTVEELSAKPTPPPAGQKKIYCKDDGKCYTLDADDREKEVGSGAGGAGAGKNYVKGGDFESGLIGVTFNDSGDGLVDGTGGTPSAFIEIVGDAEALAGEQSLKYTPGINANNGWSYEFSIDAEDFATLFEISFSYQINIPGSYADGDLKVAIYDRDQNALVPIDEGEIVFAATGPAKHAAKFRTHPSSKNYRLIIYQGTANTTYNYALLDSVKVGPWDGVGTVAQTTWSGAVKYASASGCIWERTGLTAESWGSFEPDSDCATPTAHGSASIPDTKIPAIKFASIPAGRLVCTAMGNFRKAGAVDQGAYFRFSDGTQTSNVSGIYGATSLASTSIIQGEFTYTQPKSNVTIEIQGIGHRDNAVQINAAASSVSEFEISCVHYPNESEQVTRVGQGADLLGTIVPALTSQCPAGTLKADGSPIPSEYSGLIARIGANLPDASALVLRGTGTRTVNGRTKTGPTNPGDVQEDQFQGHHHDIRTGGTSGSENRISTYQGEGGSVLNANNSNAGVQGPITDGSNGTPRVGDETRVSAMGVTWCVVASHTYQPLVKQAVIYDDKVRAEGKSGVTSIDSNLNVTLTASNTTNLDATPSVSGRYFRIGDQVEVTLAFVVDPTTAELPFSFYSTLPIPSNFTATADALGVCVAPNNQGTIRVIASPSDDKFEFRGEQRNSDQFGYTCKINYIVK